MVILSGGRRRCRGGRGEGGGGGGDGKPRVMSKIKARIRGFKHQDFCISLKYRNAQQEFAGSNHMRHKYKRWGVY